MPGGRMSHPSDTAWTCPLINALCLLSHCVHSFGCRSVMGDRDTGDRDTIVLGGLVGATSPCVTSCSESARPLQSSRWGLWLLSPRPSAPSFGSTQLSHFSNGQVVTLRLFFISSPSQEAPRLRTGRNGAVFLHRSMCSTLSDAAQRDTGAWGHLGDTVGTPKQETAPKGAAKETQS